MRSAILKVSLLVCATLAFHFAQPVAAEDLGLLRQSQVTVALTQSHETRSRVFRVADHFESEDPQTPFVPAPQDGLIVLVRHADRDPGELLLNGRGTVRALALPGAIANISLDVIAISDFQRNKDTAAPLADDRGIVPVILPVDASLANALALMAEDSGVIWIGNVGNLDEIWDAFRLEGRPPIDYGQIAILSATGGVWEVSWRQF